MRYNRRGILHLSCALNWFCCPKNRKVNVFYMNAFTFIKPHASPTSKRVSGFVMHLCLKSTSTATQGARNLRTCGLRFTCRLFRKTVLHVKIFAQKIPSVCAPSVKRWGSLRKVFLPR